MIWRPDDGGENGGGGGEDAAHSINGEQRNAALAALGVNISRDLDATLDWFGVAVPIREHLVYPLVLAWLRDGLGEIAILPIDIGTAAVDLRLGRYGDRRKAHEANIRNVLQGYVRYAATHRCEAEGRAAERRRDEEAARSQSRPGGRLAAFTAPIEIELRQPAPPEFMDWCRTAARLCAELRQLGRSPRELPEDMALWPATYLPQLGPASGPMNRGD